MNKEGEDEEERFYSGAYHREAEGG